MLSEAKPASVEADNDWARQLESGILETSLTAVVF